MPGLQDLLRNPRRLRQFAETPGNALAALDYASQARLGRRPASRASQAKEDEPNTLETGEVIEQVQLPDGSLVKPATESGRLVKAPGKSNLYLDPTTGEPYNADPTQPTGLRSAWNNARQVTKDGKVFKTISGVGERELGPDPKAAEDAAKAEAKRAAEDKRQAFAREQRKYLRDAITGEPVPLQTDEEWAAAKQAKQAKLDEGARVKRLKDQADVIDLEADRISLTAPKPAKEDEEAFNAAESALSQFAAGQDMEKAAAKYAAAPATDEASQQAKAAAENYLAYKDKVKPAKEAEKKVQELKLRALDIKEQIINPQKWKAGKTASLAALPDDDLVAEVKAQADIINEQEEQAVGTLDTITKGRNAIVAELNSFNEEFQSQAEQGLTAEEMAALDIQKARLEQSLADYDEHNGEAKAESDAALKAAADRRDVLAVAGTELEGRAAKQAKAAATAKAKSETLAKAKPLYEGWAKGLYSDDWRTEEETPRLAQEAAKAGLDVASAKEALQTYRQLDWSNTRRDPKTGQPIAEEVRTLPDGNVTVNPTMWGDADAYKKAVDASQGTPEGKAKALEAFPKLQEIHAEKAVEILSQSANIPGADNFMAWRERKIEEDQATQGKLGFARQSPAKQAIAYMEEMKNRSWFRKAGEQVGLGLLAGFQDIATQALGVGAMVTGSETLADLAAANTENTQSVVGAQNLEGSDTDYALRVMGMGARMTPAVAAMIAGAGAVGGGLGTAAVLAGGQTAGSMFADLYRTAKEDAGLSHGEAWKKAALPAALAGTITGLLTKGMGATGLERVFSDTATQETARNTFKAMLGQFVKGAAEELPEEIADEYFTTILQESAASADPVATFKNFANTLPELAGVTALMGGAGALMQARRQAGTEGPGMAPPPEAGSPAMPVQPRPAELPSISKTGLEKAARARLASLRAKKDGEFTLGKDGTPEQVTIGARLTEAEEKTLKLLEDSLEGGPNPDVEALAAAFGYKLKETIVVDDTPTSASADVAEMVAKFNPTGATPLPQSVAATAKRTGRPPAAVARQAAAGVVKIAQGQSLESLDIEEQEALGFVNKGGKITLDTKVTPLIYLYKDKPVLRNAAAEWLTDEAQEGLAGLVNLTEAERKAQIDAEEAAAKAKPAASPTKKARPSEIEDWDWTEKGKVRRRATDEWFEEGMANEDVNAAFERAHSVGGENLATHGMAKYGTLSGAFDALMGLLQNNVDPTRGKRGSVEPGGLDVAPLTVGKGSAAAMAGTTGGGTSYRDGPFILVQSAAESKKGKGIKDMASVSAILVNDANAGQLEAIRREVHKLRPDIIVELYSKADEVARQLNQPAKKKAGQAAPAKAESTPQAGPEVKTSDSLSENEGSTPSPATTLDAEMDRAHAEWQAGKKEVDDAFNATEPHSKERKEAREKRKQWEEKNGQVPPPSSSNPLSDVGALSNKDSDTKFSLAGTGWRLTGAKETSIRGKTILYVTNGKDGGWVEEIDLTDQHRQILGRSDEVVPVEEKAPPDRTASAFAKAAAEADAANDAPAPAQESPPEPAPAATPTGLSPAQEAIATPEQPPAAPEPDLTPKQADQMARAKAAHEKSKATIQRMENDPEIRAKKLYAEGMRFAAIKRQITGKLTGKEQEAKAKREASNYEGKAVSVDGKNAEVIGNAFGKVKVKFEDGTKATVPAAKIKPPVEAVPAPEADKVEPYDFSAAGKENDQRYKSALEKAGNAKAVEMQSPTFPGLKVVITKDPENPTKWRASRFDAKGASGHQVFDTFEEAIADFTGKSIGPSFGRDFVVTRTSGARKFESKLPKNLLGALQAQEQAHKQEKTFNIPSFEESGITDKAILKELVSKGLAAKEYGKHTPTFTAAAELAHSKGQPFWPGEFPIEPAQTQARPQGGQTEEAKEFRRVTNQSIQLGELAQQSRDAKVARQTEAEQRLQSLSDADLLGMDKNELNDLHADLTRGLGHPYPDKQVLLRQLNKLRQPAQAGQEEASQPAPAAKPPEQMTPEEWRNNHFDENEDRGLPADYFADHQFNETRKNKTQVSSVNGIDFLTDQYGGVHAFDGEKNVGYGDGKAFVVEPAYQRRGIGTEIIAIAKKELPTKRIGSQTAAGQALVASFHKRILADATKANSPVNAAAVDAYGIALPEGYTREGDLYVYRPAPSPAPASQLAGQAEATSLEDGVFSYLQNKYTDKEIIEIATRNKRGAEIVRELKKEGLITKSGEFKRVEKTDPETGEKVTISPGRDTFEFRWGVMAWELRDTVEEYEATKASQAKAQPAQPAGQAEAFKVGDFVRANGKGPVFKIESIGSDGWLYLANGQGSYSAEDAAKILVKSTEDAATKEAVKGGFPGFDSQPAQPPRPATPEGRAEAVLAEYEATVRQSLVGRPDKAAKDLAGRKLDLAKRLRARLKAMTGAVDYDVYAKELREKSGELEVKPVGRKGSILFINPEKLIDRLTAKHATTEAAREGMDTFILHEFIHKAAIGNMDGAKIIGLYNLLTPEAKAASKALYLSDSGLTDFWQDDKEFAAAHEWFAQLVEARLRGKISNQAEIEASQDPAFRDRLLALLRDFVAQLRDIAKLVTDKAQAARIEAEADAVQAIVADMAAKAGLEIQAGPEAAGLINTRPLEEAERNARKRLESLQYPSVGGGKSADKVDKLRKEYAQEKASRQADLDTASAKLKAAYAQNEAQPAPQAKPAQASQTDEADKALAEAFTGLFLPPSGLRLKQTRAQLIKATEDSSDWKDWYQRHEDTLTEFFGVDADLFQRILSVTSQAASVKANVGLALKAYVQLKTGAPFEGYLPAVIKNLQRVKDAAQVQGQKIAAYQQANTGADEVVVVDRHISRMLFGVDSPTAKQFQKGQQVLTQIANVLGWQPRQVQAAMWAASIRKAGNTPESYDSYLRELNKRGTLNDRIGSVVPTGIQNQRSGGSGGLDSTGSNQASLRLPPQGSLEQTDLPRDRRDAMMKAASVLVDAGVKTPAELAARLDKLAPGGQLRQYSRAFWRLMTGFDSTLEEKPDWQAVYQASPAPVAAKADQTLWADLSRFFASENSDGSRAAALKDLKAGTASDDAKGYLIDLLANPNYKGTAKSLAPQLIARLKATMPPATSPEAPTTAEANVPVTAEMVSKWFRAYYGGNAPVTKVLPGLFKIGDSLYGLYSVNKLTDQQVLNGVPFGDSQMLIKEEETAEEVPALPASVTPAQAEAVAEEAAMPEPAKQAAPFDAAAAKGQKKFLLAEVAAAVKAAPKRADMTQEQKDAITNLEDKFRNWDSLNEEERKTYASELAAAKADAERLIGYVTIEVPGDGTFTILNEKEALYRFQKKADKFPVSQAKDDLPAKPTAQAPTAVPALKKAKTTADVVAAVFPMVSTDTTRGEGLQKVKGEGAYLWATNGRFAVRVEHENGGGKGQEAIVYDEKGNAQPWPEGEQNPTMEAIIPDDKAFTPYTLDTARWFSLMSQARAIIKELPNESSTASKAVSLYRNPDGSLGLFASDINRGDYAHNIQPEAKILAAYSPDYFQTVLRVARNLGNEQIELRIGDDVSPATLRAGKALFVLMPMRVNGAPAYAPQAARPAPPVTAEASPAAEPPAQPGQTREEAAEAARAIAAQDPSIPPPAPDDLETLQALRDRANRKPYSSDKLTPARLAVGIRAGWVTKTKEAKLTEKGSSQLSEWQQQQSAHDSALGALSDKLVDEAVSKWDRENDPTSWEAINAAKQAAAQPGQEAAQPASIEQRISEAEAAGVVLSEKDKSEIRRLDKAAADFTKQANQLSGYDPMNKGTAFPMGVGYTKMTKRSSQRIDTGVKKAGEAVVASNKAKAATAMLDNLLAGKGTDADKAAKIERTKDYRREVVAKLLNWKKGDKVGTFEITRINKNSEGYPTSYNFKGDGIIAGVNDKVDVVREVFKGNRAEFEQMVNAAKQPSQPTQAPAPEGQGGQVQPITGFDSARAFIAQLRKGEVTAEQVRTAWAQLKAQRPAILADLNKMKVDELLPMAGMSARKSDGKASIADSVLSTLDLYFNPDDSISYSYGGDFQTNKDNAMDEKVAKWTDEMIVEQAKARREAAEASKAAKEKALTNPETADEWDRFVWSTGRKAMSAEEVKEVLKLKSSQARNEAVRKKGESILTPEQLAAYDAVRGIDRKAQEQARTEAKARVYGVASGVEADIIETKHTQKGHDLFVVKLSERVERPVYDSLNAASKKLGGYYSSYAKGGAVPGFQFTTRAAAENFIAVSKGETVDQKEQIQERQEAKKSATASRLTAVAEVLDGKADGILNADRKTNTAKRAREAAGQEATARGMKAMAQTMRNLAAAMESGEATHLDGVRMGTHVETLDGMARGAMTYWIRDRKMGMMDREKTEAGGPTAEMMDATRIPYPYLDKGDILRLVEKGRETPGAKLLAERVAKIRMNENEGQAVTLRSDSEMDDVKELAQKVTERGKPVWDTIKWKYETYDRLKAMGLTNLPSLRAALREFLQYRGQAAKEDPIKKMERELVGMKLPGFFPTPRAVIDEMVGIAGIEPGMKVLEPSAGKGDIAEAMQEAGAEVDAIELSNRLRDILTAKGVNVIDNDFTSVEPEPKYDAVVMNPPFENGQDMEHIRHAYKFLKPGGKLVAIMSAGPFYRQDKQATAFREWLDSVGGSHEAMPEGSFAGSDAFRQTGVRTQMVTITKPADEGQPASLALPPAGQAVTAGRDATDTETLYQRLLKKYDEEIDPRPVADFDADQSPITVEFAGKKWEISIRDKTFLAEDVEDSDNGYNAHLDKELTVYQDASWGNVPRNISDIWEEAPGSWWQVPTVDSKDRDTWDAEQPYYAVETNDGESGWMDEEQVTLSLHDAVKMYVKESSEDKRLVYYTGDTTRGKDRFGDWDDIPKLEILAQPSFVEKLQRDFPGMTREEAIDIAKTRNTDNTDTFLVAQAYARHNYTDYDDRLKNARNLDEDTSRERSKARFELRESIQAVMERWTNTSSDESGQVIPLSERFNPASQSILRNPPAPEGGPAASQEASQPEADEEADPDLAAFMAEQQRLAEEEAAAREALRNDPDAIDAVQASGKMSARNLSKQFEYPEARAVYQALTAARDQLGGPETVQLDKLREWAKKTFESDPEKYVQWAADMAEESKLLDVDEQAVLGQAFQFLTREARLTGDKNIRALLNKVGNYYLDTGTRLAQAMSARRDPLESPQERWTKALDIVFGPSEAVRRKLRILPTQAGKARRIASLEAELAEARGSRRADVEAALKTARAQETKEELLEKDDAESEKIKQAVLKNMGVTEDDLMLSGTDRVALQSAILDLPAVKEGLDAYKGKDNDGYNIMRLAFRGFSDEHIANYLNLNQDDVGKFIHDATAAIIRPAVAAQVKAGTGFGGLIKAGFARLKKAVGLGLPPKIRPLEDWRTLIKGKKQTLDQVTAEVNRVMGYALQSAKARNSRKLMSKVINTPNGQKVRVFVPFDPDDMANYYAFAREYTAAKASAFDKVYEYWINWPLLSGPQTQVANITGNAAQVAWHYTGQRLAEATLNLAYQDPNSAQFREFKHILKGFWQGIGPAFEMARETFLTEGDTIRHKYLGQPLEIDVVDGDLDKVGNIRASVGGQAGRISRLPGRVLRFTDAFFKTAIMYAEASAVAYRRAHVEAKRQGLKGQARAAFIDTEIANTLNDTSSAVWGEVMKTAEELLFQDDNSATEIVDTVLGGYKGIKDLEKLLAEAEAKGDSDLAAKLQKRIRSRKFVGSLMRWIFPFQRTPTNIVRTGIKKAGGSAISLLYGLTRAGWLAMGKKGVPVIKSYPKAMQIKDASETLLAGLGWLALASMLEGDDNDDEKPVLLVGTRSHSLKERAATDQFLRKYGGENSIVWQDGKGKVLGSLPFGRYEPAATLLTTWIDAYRNYQEVKRLKSQGENASYSTYMLSSLVSSLEDKSFLQGFANAMQFVRDVEEKRENPDQSAGVKMLMNNVIPNLIKQPLRNMDDVLRERTTAGPGYAALPNPTIAPKLPVFAAQPKISTTGERLPKAFTPPARLLFQANTKVTPQPDALLYRANRLHPTKRWSPQPLQRDDYNADPPGKAKPVPIIDPAKKRQFAELAGRLYAANAAKVAAKAMPSEKAAPGESLIKAFKKAREDAMAAARAQAHAMGLHKATATP